MTKSIYVDIMINPQKITNYNLKNKDLQFHIIFWLLVAGKTAKVIAKRIKPIFDDLERLWHRQYPHRRKPLLPLTMICELAKNHRNEQWLSRILQKNGIGCHSVKAEGLVQLSKSGINLKVCSASDLETIKGIGKKTSQCFILHTRPDAQCAGLDTHILSCLRDLGHNVPDSTPDKKKYQEVEQIFLKLAQKVKKTPAKLDLIIWRVYSSHKHLKPMLLKALNGQT